MGEERVWRSPLFGSKYNTEESACSAGDLGSIPGSGRFPWRREWQPTLVFLPRESHGQRSLAGYSPWGHNELDTTQRLTQGDNTEGQACNLRPALLGGGPSRAQQLQKEALST